MRARKYFSDPDYDRVHLIHLILGHLSLITGEENIR